MAAADPVVESTRKRGGLVDLVDDESHQVDRSPAPNEGDRVVSQDQASPANRRHAIEVDGLNHVFVSDSSGGDQRLVHVVKDLSLRVEEGEFVAIIGPSGCGKTTVLNILAGLLEVQDGEVLIDGQRPQLGRPDVSYMLARDALLPWRTALDNVCMGLEFRGVPRSERKPRARELLAAVGLEDSASAYRHQLSQGMRQRVALARTFAPDASVLLMDEPFGALDSGLKLQLGEFLLDLWTRMQRTVVFVTHDLYEAIGLADRIILMRPGAIVREVVVPLPRPRSIEELQEDPAYHDLYRRLWNDMKDINR